MKPLWKLRYEINSMVVDANEARKRSTSPNLPPETRKLARTRLVALERGVRLAKALMERCEGMRDQLAEVREMLHEIESMTGMTGTNQG